MDHRGQPGAEGVSASSGGPEGRPAPLSLSPTSCLGLPFSLSFLSSLPYSFTPHSFSPLVSSRHFSLRSCPCNFPPCFGISLMHSNKCGIKYFFQLFRLVGDTAPIPSHLEPPPEETKDRQSHPKMMKGVLGNTDLSVFLLLQTILNDSPDNRRTNRRWENSREG